MHLLLAPFVFSGLFFKYLNTKKQKANQLAHQSTEEQLTLENILSSIFMNINTSELGEDYNAAPVHNRKETKSRAKD